MQKEFSMENAQFATTSWAGLAFMKLGAMLLFGLAGCQKLPEANSPPASSIAQSGSPIIDGRKIYREMGLDRDGCVELAANFPFDPIKAARDNVAMKKDHLFAESNTDMGYGIVWGLMEDTGEGEEKLRDKYREIVYEYGRSNFNVSDTCVGLSKFYEIVLGTYNKEVIRLLENKIK